jgi:hypothetical protein
VRHVWELFRQAKRGNVARESFDGSAISCSPSRVPISTPRCAFGTFALIAGILIMGSSAYASVTIVNISAGPDGSGVLRAYAYPIAPGSFSTKVNP